MNTILTTLTDILVSNAILSITHTQSNSVLEVAKILAVSCGWVGALFLYIRGIHKKQVRA